MPLDMRESMRELKERLEDQMEKVVNLFRTPLTD